MAATGRLFLIDGTSQMYRAYHAIQGLTGPDGKSTNAVYGFVTMLRKLIVDHDPQFIVAAFDLSGPTFRNELDADYKANRPPMPTDLSEQVEWVHEACEALGVPVITADRYEADDVIGTLATRASDEGLEVVIVTSDKDFFQVVNDSISVFNPRDQGVWYDTDGVKEKLGVMPSQVVDLLALMGDAVDNVKGVPGIGEKGARELISTYGSLDELLTKVNVLPQKRYRNALLSNTDDALQSRALVQICIDVPVQFNAEALRYHGPVSKRCFELFSSLGFRTLLADYAPTAQTVESDYSMVCSATELESIIATVRDAGRCGLCVLADDHHSMSAHAVGLALSAGSRHASYIPLGHQSSLLESGLDTATALRLLRPMLSDPAVLKVGHNLKVDAIALALVDVPLVGFDVDTMIASYLLDSTRSTYQIEDLALEHVSYKPISSEGLLGRGAKAKKFSELSPEEVINYACERSALVLELADRLMDMLNADGLESLYRELELPLIDVLVAVEREGIRIDTDALRALSKKLESELSERQRVIYDLAGIEFNINSPKQLSEILFEKLKLPTLKKTRKTRAASTSVVVLEELAQIHELPREVLTWRSLQKLKGTYVDALPKLVNSKTGRVHTSFNQAVAATGRLSSSDPNLQNIPVRTELGLTIRSAFVASPEAVFISADYSQIELRVLAHLSKDESLIQAFLRGDDIHSQTAEKVFGSDSGLEPHELRRRAKIINYSLLYGKTAFTLAKDINVTQQMAQAFIDAYFEGFPRVRSFIDDTIEGARESGFVATMFGRRRRVPELVSRNGQVRAAAERAAVNMPIQGTAADILKQAMIDIHGGLPASARMILTVHDELVFEVPEASANGVAAFVQDRMEKIVSLAVPLTVDVGIGSSWKEAKA